MPPRVHRENVDAGGVQSAEVAMRVLIALADGGGELTLKEIGASAQMPPAKAHRYLASLIRAGFVEQNPYSGLYELSGESLRVGLVALGRLDVMEIGGRILYELRAQSDLCVTMSVWGTSGATIVRKLETSRPVIVNTRIGSIVPLLRSAAGNIFGAFLDPEKTAEILREELARQKTRERGVPGNMEEAKRLFAKVRKDGMSRVTGQMMAGVTSLGAPVFNAEGSLAAAITALGPSGSFPENFDGPVGRAVRDAANKFSARLGYKAAKTLPAKESA